MIRDYLAFELKMMTGGCFVTPPLPLPSTMGGE